MGRLLNILDYALLSLRRKVFKNLAVGIILSLIVFLFSSFQLVSRGLTDSAERLLQSAPDITVQGMSAGRQVALPLDVISDLEAIYGISSIEKRIWGYYFDESNGANYTVIGLSQDVKEQTANALKIGEVRVSRKVSELLQLGDRSHFSLFKPDLSQKAFKVVETFPDYADIVVADLIFMNIEDARELFAVKPGFVTDLMVEVVNPVEIDTVARKVSDLLPWSRVITKNQILKTYKVVFSWRSGFGMICLLTSVLAFAILCWDKASGLSMEEVREIGILKLVGWQTSDIVLLRFSESLVVGGCSFSAGYLMSWLHVSVFDGALFRPVLLGWSVLKPGISLLPIFAIGDLFLVLAVSIVPYLAATAVPGWRAAAVRADSVV